jgi:solute carrier family 34 (sodium-dependent phosphate cotransporter)
VWVVTSRSDSATLGQPAPLARAARAAWWAVRLAAALFVFVGALQLMKTGASSLSVLEEGGYLVRNAGSTLGLGWLGALLVLSGSPIAATSLTLVAAGEESVSANAFSELQGFTMLTGSRLGAAFVVLVTAALFALRAPDGQRKAPVTCAMFTLFATAMIYVPAAILGAGLLRWDTFHSLELSLPGQLVDLIDLVYGPFLDRAETYSPALVFLGGLACLLVAFKLIDTVLPALDPDSLQSSRTDWLTRKWPMFFLGSLVALVTMSISVALTVLVPLVAKRYVKVDHVLPYILGANITTLGDTMFAAFTLDSPAAVRIVLAEVIATSVLSVVLLAFFYPQILNAMWHLQVLGAKSARRLAVFTVVLFLIPVTIIGVSGLFS